LIEGVHLQRVLIRPPGGAIELEVDLIGAERTGAPLLVSAPSGLANELPRDRGA
jgi:hypothetical protein